MPHPSSAPLVTPRSVLVVVLAALSVLLAATGLLPATAATTGALLPPTEPSARTWVVDAIDDVDGNRWESPDTGTSEVVIGVGDTVEWQFDRAGQQHDLTSLDTGSTWTEDIAEYRAPLDPPVRHTFTEPGTYYYTCSIHGTLMHGRVVVLEPGANRPPGVTTTVEPLVGPAPLDVHATAVATDPDGDPLTYTWDFGTTDAPATTAHAMFRYTTPGTYTATLEVSDGRGGLFTDTFDIVVGAESAVTATATPTMGAAPLTVDFLGGAVEAGATYDWDFGDGGSATGSAPAYTYDRPGTYTATVTATGADGELGTDTIDVMVTDSDLPAVTAAATPTSGSGPLAVAFSTEVTTTGTFAAFADGLTTYPDLAGAARLVRSRGSSYASLDVTGLRPTAAHNVHVHEKPCATENAGAHFRFDETKPFAEPNEIWLPFTSRTDGTTGLVTETQSIRAGDKAVSIVIHDPDNPAKRIGCADLGPSTADLSYAWDFGDGTTGSGPDPDHTYARPGTYTATVTVRSVHAGHGGPAGSRTGSVQVRVLDTVAPSTRVTSGPRGTVASDRASFRFAADETATFACRLDGRPWRTCAAATTFRGLADGKHRLRVRATDTSGNTDPTPVTRAWVVDTTGPAVRRTRAGAAVRATVTDRLSKVRSVVVRIDGRVALTRYDARSGKLTAAPARPLGRGQHTVRVVAVDAVGNRSVTTWRVRI